ncbi:SDR family oxidoreductase [Paenibacillus chitinolyticus]|uniref:SDR family oxidoreductase n=1 Tax=Paenibacillus chitinolyticus TaxID=79263 RepID=UPI00295F0004|nr:SDR family oxidoreductase [Paenibacillus chitinolyticus]
MLFAKEGAKVVVTDVQEDKSKSSRSYHQGKCGDAIGFYHNVASEDNWIQVVKDTVKAFGTFLGMKHEMEVVPLSTFHPLLD